MVGEQVITPPVFRRDIPPRLAQFLVKAGAPEGVDDSQALRLCGTNSHSIRATL
jgi:hypothetical protein